MLVPPFAEFTAQASKEFQARVSKLVTYLLQQLQLKVDLLAMGQSVTITSLHEFDSDSDVINGALAEFRPTAGWSARYCPRIVSFSFERSNADLASLIAQHRTWLIAEIVSRLNARLAAALVALNAGVEVQVDLVELCDGLLPAEQCVRNTKVVGAAVAQVWRSVDPLFFRGESSAGIIFFTCVP